MKKGNSDKRLGLKVLWCWESGPVCNRFTDRCIVIVDRHCVQYDTKILKTMKDQRWEVVFQIVIDQIFNYL